MWPIRRILLRTSGCSSVTTAPSLPTLSAAASASFHTSATISQSTAVSSGKPAGGASSGKARNIKDEKVYDYKPMLPKHQTVFNPGLYSTPPAAATWTPTTRRVGVIALKAGMCSDYDQWGVRRALTALRLEDVIVTNVMTEAARGYTALQVGAGLPKPHKMKKPQVGYFAALGVAPRITLGEFRVTPDAVLPVGTSLEARHFVPGQYVNVCGVSQGKGFQGGMKRHGFAGQKASHGNSVSHRALGATGCRQDPGKVQKGKAMPGHMGEDTVTVECLRVYKIDIKRNLVYVEGAVPGRAGTYIRVYDAPKKPFKASLLPPFPTYSPSASDAALAAKWAAGAFLAPDEEARLGSEGGLAPGYEREPAYEWVAAPSAVDPFAIPEDDEAEEV